MRELTIAVVVAGLVGAVMCAPVVVGGGTGLLDVLLFGLERPLEYKARRRRCSPSGRSSTRRQPP